MRRFRFCATLAVFLFIGAGAMADMLYAPLSDSDRARLDARRAHVTRYLDAENMARFQSPAGKLGTLRALLATDTLAPYSPEDIEALGVVLGDVFVQDMGFHWIAYRDERGQDIALRHGETDIVMFPVSMIDKRLSRGEEIDIFDLYNGVAAEAEKLIAQRP